MACINISDPLPHSTKLAKSGLCFRCCGRLSRGNCTTGRKKRIAALKGIDQVPQAKRQRRLVRRSFACKGFESYKVHLVKMLRRLDSSRAVSTYAKSVVKRVHTQSKLEKIRVTLIEGPSYPGSHLAQVNAELGGASLRIVEPINQKPGKHFLRPPKLKLGKCVDWPLDLFSDEGCRALGDYLRKIKPLAGTHLVHYAYEQIVTLACLFFKVLPVLKFARNNRRNTCRNTCMRAKIPSET